MLCAWIAPIRYSRYHRIGHPLSPSRRQLADLIDGWAASATNIGYRTYNYNLAECCVPFSKISTWTHDIPYLKKLGCVGINLETLTNWQIYGPPGNTPFRPGSGRRSPIVWMASTYSTSVKDSSVKKQRW